MKRIVILTMLLLIIIFTCGCGRRIITCDADEIIQSDWYAEFQDGSIQLSFCDDNAALQVKSGNEETMIEGFCTADDSRIVILDESRQFVFPYVLKGKKLTLKYEGEEITLFGVRKESVT